jgi:hypothetical protein
MTYGIRPDLHPQGRNFLPPLKGVGLLFLCYQSSIAAGFENLQCAANDPSFPFPDTGLDPVIGQDCNPHNINQWPCGYGASRRVEVSFDKTVTLKGGEYFFTPSIDFLKYGVI